jgi:thymidylate kinase
MIDELRTQVLLDEFRGEPAVDRTALAGVLLGAGPLEARARLFATIRPDRVRPAVVAFAGLDGAGKSTQADLLTEQLQQVGLRVQRRWAGFKSAKQIRSRLPILDRERVVPGVEPPPYDRVIPSALRDRPAGQRAWVYAVVAVNLVNLWGKVLRGRGQASVLVFDRFTPDAAVKLELNYHAMRGIDVRRQQWLFDRLAPRPDVAFWVDVPADVALSRRPEESPAKLEAMTTLYAELATPYGLHRLDGTRPSDVLAREVLRRVWRRLP